MTPRFVSALLLLGVVACDRAPPATGTSADHVPRYVLVEELRIGDTNDPDVGFSSVGGVAVDDDGLAYVLDSQQRQIRVFDDAGRLVRRIGRAGAGPGEFGAIHDFGVFGDTLWVGEVSRVTVLSLDGEFRGTVRAPSVRIEPVPGFRVTSNAHILRRDGRLAAENWRTGTPEGVDSIVVPRLLHDTSGQIVDTAGVDITMLRKEIASLRIGNRDILLKPFPLESAVRVLAPEGMYVIDRAAVRADTAGTITIARLGAHGDTLFKRSLSYHPRAFTEATKRTMMRAEAELWASAYSLDAEVVLSRMIERMTFPPFQPPITAGRLGDDGTLWLRRENDDTPEHRWLVLDANGEPQREVVVLDSLDMQWMGGDIVWAVDRDELDVPWLLRMRMEPAGVTASESER